MISPTEKFLDIEDFLPECQQFLKELKCFQCKGIAYDHLIDDKGKLFCDACITSILNNEDESNIKRSRFIKLSILIKLTSFNLY